MNPTTSFAQALDLLSGKAGEESTRSGNKLGYVYEPDKIAVSYSRTQTLNTCPRKFQLRERLQKRSRTVSIHTSYGHAVGAGIAALFQYEGNLHRAFLEALTMWDYPHAEDSYGKEKDKSLSHVFGTIESFYLNQYPQLSADYKIAILQGKPAVELFIYLNVSDKYSYQVHIDLILQNRWTGALVIFECKTSKYAATEPQWANSKQTVGYFALIETLAKREGIPVEPGVVYICVQAGKQWDENCNFGVQILPFVKLPTVIHDFVQELMYDIERITYCEENNFYPKNGASCVEFNRPCEFFGECDMLAFAPKADIGQIYESLTLADCDYVLDLQEIVDNLKHNHLT